MSAAPQLVSPSLESRLAALESEVRTLAQTSLEQAARLDSTAELIQGTGQQEKLSLIVFSGSLDRLIAAFVLATGAAAMGMQVSMFFTFLGHGRTSPRKRARQRPYSSACSVGCCRWA